MTWKKSDYDGVYTRKMEKNKYGIGQDFVVSIRYRFNKKNYQEIIGRASMGNTPKKAFLLLSELKQNQKTGTPPFTLKEKLTIELEKQQAEQQEKTRLETENITFKDFFESHSCPSKRHIKDSLPG